MKKNIYLYIYESPKFFFINIIWVKLKKRDTIVYYNQKKVF